MPDYRLHAISARRWRVELQGTMPVIACAHGVIWNNDGACLCFRPGLSPRDSAAFARLCALPGVRRVSSTQARFDCLLLSEAATIVGAIEQAPLAVPPPADPPLTAAVH